MYTYNVYNKDLLFVATFVVALAPNDSALWPLIVRRFPNVDFVEEVR